jgi:hypothetical protein
MNSREWDGRLSTEQTQVRCESRSDAYSKWRRNPHRSTSSPQSTLTKHAELALWICELGWEIDSGRPSTELRMSFGQETAQAGFTERTKRFEMCDGIVGIGIETRLQLSNRSVIDLR